MEAMDSEALAGPGFDNSHHASEPPDRLVSSYFKRRYRRCVLLRDRLHTRSVLEISFALSRRVMSKVFIARFQVLARCILIDSDARRCSTAKVRAAFTSMTDRDSDPEYRKRPGPGPPGSASTTSCQYGGMS